MKALLIVNCNDSQKWYSGMIGKVVQYLGEDTEYRSIDNGGYTNFISLEDAEVWEVNDDFFS